MRLLLDTHTFLWFVLNDAHLSGTAQKTINDPENDLVISPASYWEIAIKVGLRKLDLHTDFDDFIQKGIIGNDFAILPIEPKHASLLTTLPPHHKDPFDRLIVAQALAEGIPVISADAQLDAYGIVRVW